MNNNKSNQEKTEHESMSNANDTTSKISITQSVIRKKFQKACMNRIEREHDVNQALKPLIANSQTSSSTIAIETNNEMQNDPNELCVKLRSLINSSIAKNMDHTHEINSIIAKLHELEILE